MAPETTDAKFYYEVKLLNKILEIPFLAKSIETKKICPDCKNPKKTLQVYKILFKKIKDENQNLLSDEEFKEINLNKLEKQINQKLYRETLVCVNCAERIGDF